MSCTAPTNTSIPNAQAEECDILCKFSYEYPLTTIVATPSPSAGLIECVVDKHSPSVEYAGQKYQAISFIIFGTPIHSFGTGNNVVGEIVIIHNKPQDPNTALYVCMPIIKTNTIDVSGPGSYLNKILENIGDSGSGTEPRVINLENFKLGKLIPNAKYYTYNGKSQGLPIDPNTHNCTITSNYIVFDTSYALPLTKNGSSIFDAYSAKAVAPSRYPNPEVYISANPPGTSMEDDIYIDCKPVGASKPEYVSIATKGAALFSASSFVDVIKEIYPILFVVIGIILMYVMWKVMTHIYSPSCPGTAGCGPKLEGPPLKCNLKGKIKGK